MRTSVACRSAIKQTAEAHQQSVLITLPIIVSRVLIYTANPITVSLLLLRSWLNVLGRAKIFHLWRRQNKSSVFITYTLQNMSHASWYGHEIYRAWLW